MIVETINEIVVDDPHSIGPNGDNQGGGADAGWNKFWWDWYDIYRMQDIVRNEIINLRYKYYVVEDRQVVLETYDIEVAKAYMMNNYGYDSQSPSRMVVEYFMGDLVADPHSIGPNAEYQGGGADAGWNKFWWDWYDIYDMQDVADAYHENTAEVYEDLFEYSDSE